MPFDSVGVTPDNLVSKACRYAALFIQPPQTAAVMIEPARQ
jgi:hypothetical protein